MLETQKLVAFVATVDSARARSFYETTLGLRFVAEDEFAIVFDANGTMLRIQKVPELSPAQFTTLGWEVTDIDSAVAALHKRGVSFERYPFLEQNEAGIWEAPGGAKIAWFRDPDGNLLSLAEM